MQWLFDIVEDMMTAAGFIKLADVGAAGYINDWARGKHWPHLAQWIPNVTFTRINIDSESFINRMTYHVGPNQLEVQDNGYYVICSSVGLDNVPANTRIHTTIKVNGVFATYIVFTNVIANEDPRILTLGFEYLEAGDLLDLWVWQNSGNPINTISQEFSTFLGAHRLS